MSLNNTKINNHKIKVYGLEVNALSFIASDESLRSDFKAVFTHGYTASKASVLPWATRLADFGISSVIFDLPGHYLGSFNEVESFENFEKNAHRLFEESFSRLLNDEKEMGRDFSGKIIMGGHSLGALLTLKASVTNFFESYKTILFLVGFGLNKDVSTHFFDTDFYQKTLNIRRQLVSQTLDSDIVFPWIRDQKEYLDYTGKKIVLISGEDDVVVSKDGADYLSEKLRDKNEVHLIKPKKLPHHQPELASTHIFNFLKKEYNF